MEETPQNFGVALVRVLMAGSRTNISGLGNQETRAKGTAQKLTALPRSWISERYDY
jgi:hypothetical protein